MEKDLFGNQIKEDYSLRQRFIEIPVSIIDTRKREWQIRKKMWVDKGIKSELGRIGTSINVSGNKKVTSNYDTSNFSKSTKDFQSKFIGKNAVSIFDASLCEVLYKWFCNEGGAILDPFAGGSVRGIVANCLGYKYTGIDIRQEQIDSNREQGLEILSVNNQPNWYVGDSNEVLDGFNNEFDFVFSCPPYADLEVYSDLDGDISNKPYNEFLRLYESIIEKSCKLLKKGSLACFVVGEVRDKNGNYIGFVPDTIRAFEKCGMKFYNEIILIGSMSRASMVCSNYMKNKKIAKIHQNVLVFKKY